MYSISLFISNNVVLISLILCYWCTVAFIITMDCWAMCYCCLCLCFSHTHIVTVVLFWFYFYWHSRLLALFFISSFCMVPSTFHLLSEWGQYVGANRLAQLNQMDQVQHVWAPVQSDQAGFRNAPTTTHDQRNTSSSQSAQPPCDLVSNKAIVVSMDLLM